MCCAGEGRRQIALAAGRTEAAEMMIIQAHQAGMDQKSTDGGAGTINPGNEMGARGGSGTAPQGAAVAAAGGTRSAARPMRKFFGARLSHSMSSPTTAASWTSSEEVQTLRHQVRGLQLLSDEGRISCLS